MDVFAKDLQFPEGPIAMPDGSVLLVEMVRGTLSRVAEDGSVDVVANCGGGPNGAAVGPDGLIYICNNGGFDDQTDADGHFGSLGMPPRYDGGSIQVVDPTTGAVTELYSECDGHPLSAPNDIVFDADGSFWFTDLGKSWPRHVDHGAVYYAATDGSKITEVIHPLVSPNGIALSPDGSILYVSETNTGRVYRWEVSGPGSLVANSAGAPQRRLVHSLSGTLRFDSMAVDREGHVCVATIGGGGAITDIAPDGTITSHPTGDSLTTNICFGGTDLRTAFITCPGSGTLRTTSWPRGGLALVF